MNQLINILNTLSPIIKNGFLIITSLFSTLHSTTTTNNEIIKTVNKEDLGTYSSQLLINIPKEISKSTESIGKMNKLNLRAPNYDTIKIPKDNEYNSQNLAISIKNKGSDESIVHIRCIEELNGKTQKITTGSGVIISSSGLILTAAHVASQVYKSTNNCYIKIGNPASGNYPIKVVFIDQNWSKKAVETGESDIAMLQIDSERLDKKDVSSINNASYAILSPISTVNQNESISIKSYPTDSYGKYGVLTALPRKSESNSIYSLYNFNGSISSTFDLIETQASALGQSGASGGGIFNNQGQLIGIISNTVPSDILIKNKIRAISIKYIESEISRVTGNSIYNYNK